MDDRLDRLEPGTPIPYGGDRITRVSPELAEAFRPGDRVVVVQETGDLLHIPRDAWDQATAAVAAAAGAFSAMGTATDDQLDRFYAGFAARLVDDTVFEPVASANEEDVERAHARGRSTTRLRLTDRMRADMVEGLHTWRRVRLDDTPIEVVSHDGWRVEQRRAGLGAVGFVFEGRPNVFADATGVLRSGNTVVFRIGSDALGTARAMMTHLLDPALEDADLSPGAVSLVDSPARAAGWAMFADRRLALAVARGSGAAVAQLGAVARQAGTPVSLHGTGGAWMLVSPRAEPQTVEAAVRHSLDRKVCNTLNTLVITKEGAAEQVPAALAGLTAAAVDLGTNPKLHLVGDVDLPAEWYADVAIARADGAVTEPRTERLDFEDIGTEWEWEASPEMTLCVVDAVEEGIEAFNRFSPRFIASLLSPDPDEHEDFYARIDAPFVGNGFTRWVDGQYALGRPELGLSNWQTGRLLGRGGVLSGDSVFTIRTRAVVDRYDISR